MQQTQKKPNRLFPSFSAFDQLRDGVDRITGGLGSSGQERFADTNSQKTFVILFSVVIIASLVFLVGLARLQLFQHRMYLERAKQNSSKNLVYTPPRGIITDRNGAVIAYNRPVFELFLDISKLPKGVAVDQFLAKVVFPDSISPVRERRLSGQDTGNAYFISSDNQYTVGLAYRSFTLEHPEFFVRILSERIYPFGKPLSHLIGYVGLASEDEWDALRLEDSHALLSEKIGKTGFEKLFENELKGERGITTIETNAFGNAVRLVEQQTSSGIQSVQTTIDLELQKTAFDALEGAIRASGGSGGAVLVSDLETGDILTMTSSPSYDNNIFIERNSEEIQRILESEGKPLFFRAVSGEYPSGSIIKPVFALAALQEGLITPHTTIRSVGGIRVGDFFFPDWKEGGHGTVDVVRALADSVNTFFYYIGGGFEDFHGLGVGKMGEYATMFGIGTPIGVGIGGEQTGFIPTPEWKETVKHDRWYVGDTYHLSIGQGDLLVTPIQMLNMIAIIANKGLVQPLRLSFSNKSATRSIPIAKEHFEVVQRGLREAVLSGSARSLSNLPVSVAGKTGTAEVGGKAPNAWFVGFTPFERPRYAMVVLVEGGGEGSVSAVPVARTIIQELLKRYPFN